jgi:hypothetical protein
VTRNAYERSALIISWKRRLEMGPQVGATIRDESALSRLIASPGNPENVRLAIVALHHVRRRSIGLIEYLLKKALDLVPRGKV